MTNIPNDLFNQNNNDINDGIEEEVDNGSVTNEIPFNPNDISINIVPRTIGQLVDMLEYNEIVIPKYQILPNLWDAKKKSRFIESLMLNIPIPLFYFDEGEDKKWRVIDGLQRISTLEHFILGEKKDQKDTLGGIKGPLRLENLELRTDFEGKLWSELPKDIQRRILTNLVTINLIGKGTPDQVKYNIFSRINQGATVLTAQEIRSALFQGYRLEFLEKLVSGNTGAGKSFIEATCKSVSSRRQEDLDFATRFVSFYLLGYEKYIPDMDTFLTSGTKAIPEDLRTQNQILSVFEKSMNRSFSLFNNNTFRKIMDDNKRRQINKSLFEIMSVGFAKISEDEFLKIEERKELFIEDYMQLQKNEKFWNSITTGTASKESVRVRHEEFNKLLERYIS